MEAKINEQQIVIGMVGFPNVGKSSVINSFLRQKKVAVASQAGKTKHLQTHVLRENIVLCDSPGLVFPSFTNSKAELVCNGVLPIDTLKDYLSPVQLVCRRIKWSVLRHMYKLNNEQH